jgi:hypothetical protein
MSRLKKSEGKQEQNLRDLFPLPTPQQLEDCFNELQSEREYYNARNAAFIAGEDFEGEDWSTF